MRRPLLFIVAILASAFLIFLVQPMVGKRILPWFGGTLSVWTICLAFYQTALFIGYAYAHVLIRFASPTLQLVLHASLIGAAFVALPVLPGESWQPTGVSSPSTDIIVMLVSNVALPFIVLASTGPLVQAWFARCYPDRSPYPLYAVSNAGSFAALVAYPFVFEPRLPLSTTGTLWSYAFVATVAAVLACAAVARHARSRPQTVVSTSLYEETHRPSVGRATLWVLLAGCAVILLMGVSNSITRDIASVPFLWILPLATYLLTFMLCFSSERIHRPTAYLLIAFIAFFLTLGWPFVEKLSLPVFGVLDNSSITGFVGSAYVQIPSYCLLLFASSMIMHGELYRLRPASRELTFFYLCVSGGGALGGLFVGLLSPIIFDDYYEIRVGLLLAVVLFLISDALPTSVTQGRSVRGRGSNFVASLGLVLAVLALWPSSKPSQEELIYQERNFFGVLRVVDVGSGNQKRRKLRSGTTLHGWQLLAPNRRLVPTSYYGRATAIGMALATRSEKQRSKIGVIGLGVGTLAAYGREGDQFRIYEIDPAVEYIARDSGYFSFLEESPAEVEIILGDARLAIADEQVRGGSQKYDFLVLDAFNSDAIPVHLLTFEAFRLYRQALSRNGVLAVHVSNRHFNLAPLVVRAGFEAGLESLYVRTPHAPRYESNKATWVLLSQNSRLLDEFVKVAKKNLTLLDISAKDYRLRRVQEESVRDVSLWSDDYSDLFGALWPHSLRLRPDTPTDQP